MNIGFLLVAIWIITIFIGIKLLYLKVGKNSILQRIFGENVVSKNNSVSIFQKIGRIKFFTNPGFLVKKFTDKKKIKEQLRKAGDVLQMEEFLGLKQFVVSVFSIYIWLYILFGEVSWKNSFLLLLVFVLVFKIPDLWLQVQKEKRQKTFELEVPYFVDLLSLTLQTGMNLETSLRYVATNMQGSLSDEIRENLGGIEFGQSFESVLKRMTESVCVPEFADFIFNLNQAKKLGVSLSKTLKIQSNLIQTRRRQKAEELSRTASVKISIPLVLFVFPALLIIYLGPVILQMIGK